MVEYQAGVCNINRKETKKRYFTGLIGLLVAFILSGIYLKSYSKLVLLLLIFFSSMIGFQGIIQGRNSFCVARAKKGTRKTTGEKVKVIDGNERHKDNLKAKRIIFYSFNLGAIFSLSVYLLKTVFI